MVIWRTPFTLTQLGFEFTFVGWLVTRQTKVGFSKRHRNIKTYAQNTCLNLALSRERSVFVFVVYFSITTLANVVFVDFDVLRHLHSTTKVGVKRLFSSSAHLRSISSTFYEQLLRAKISNAKKTVSFCTFGTYASKSCI